MSVYMPVLQARKAEFTALGEISAADVPLVLPALEATGGGKDDETLDQIVCRLFGCAKDHLLKDTAPGFGQMAGFSVAIAPRRAAGQAARMPGSTAGSPVP